MGLHDAGVPFQVWNVWSSGGTKYPGEDECHYRWKSFSKGDGITIKTLYGLAKKGGWKPEPEVMPPPMVQLETDEVWLGFFERIKKWRGQDLIGFKTNIQALNAALLGLRGITLVGADTGIGKTMLTLQMAMDILTNHEDTCCLFLSMEMSKDRLRQRIAASRTSQSWVDYILKGNEDKNALALEATRPPRKNLWLVDYREIKGGDLEILAMAEAQRQATNTNRTLIVMDYFQLWKCPIETRTDLEEEIWKVEALRRIREGLNEDDAIVVISEVVKSGKVGDRLTNKSIMGTARLTYAADACILMQTLNDNEFYQHLTGNAIAISPREYPLKKSALTKKKDEIEDFAESIKKYCGTTNTWPVFLEVTKGRDGTHRGDVPVTMYYNELSVKEGFFPPANSPAIATKEVFNDPFGDVD